MKKVLKRISKYLIITLLLLLGLMAVGVLYLFFFPSSLFGVKYISHNVAVYSKGYEIADIDTLEVYSNAFPVVVETSTGDKLAVKVYDNTLGFVKVKNSTANFTYVKDGSTLKINVTEPSGLIFKNKSKVTITVPESVSLNLALNNNHAKTVIESSKVKINHFSYTSTSGELNLLKGKINGSIAIVTDDANVYIDKDFALNNNQIKLSMLSGKFYGNQSTFGNVQVVKTNSGVTYIQKCNKIEAELNAGGRINVGTANDVNITSKDTNVSIGTVNSSCLIKLTESGRAEVGTVNCFASIHTNAGSIRVNKSSDVLDLQSENGSITVTDATMRILAITNYGDISISFANDAPKYDTVNYFRALNVNTANGKIVAKGVDNINLVIRNNGSAEIYMDDVLGNNNTIQGNSKSVYVNINANAKYALTSRTVSGNVSVNLTQIPAFGDGYTQKDLQPVEGKNYKERTDLINGSLGTNSLLVSTTSGPLKIRDTLTSRL